MSPVEPGPLTSLTTPAQRRAAAAGLAEAAQKAAAAARLLLVDDLEPDAPADPVDRDTVLAGLDDETSGWQAALNGDPAVAALLSTYSEEWVGGIIHGLGLARVVVARGGQPL